MLQKDYERFLQQEIAHDLKVKRDRVVSTFLDATIEATRLGISLGELMSLAVEMRDSETF